VSPPPTCNYDVLASCMPLFRIQYRVQRRVDSSGKLALCTSQFPLRMPQRTSECLIEFNFNYGIVLAWPCFGSKDTIAKNLNRTKTTKNSARARYHPIWCPSVRPHYYSIYRTTIIYVQNCDTRGNINQKYSTHLQLMTHTLLHSTNLYTQ
jgi:hypothetical protein